MLPEQQDILWTFLSLMFAIFAFYVFVTVVKECRKRDDVNGKLWGGVFGAFLLVMFLETVHMFDLNQGQQLSFFFVKMVLTVFLLLLTWGVFLKGQ